MRDEIQQILDRAVKETLHIYDLPKHSVKEVTEFLQQHFEYQYRELLMSKNPETAIGEQLDNLFRRKDKESDSDYRERMRGMFK